MASPEQDLQVALRTLLRTVIFPVAGDYSDIRGRIHDNVPDELIFPYIRFGQMDVEDETDVSDCFIAGKYRVSIHVFSDKGGRSELREITYKIKKAIRDWDGDLTEHGLADIEIGRVTYMDDPAKRVTHSVIPIVADIQEVLS